ncbi:dihydrodipicolinate synthase family protein [Parafilimonas sp.]|uniref:dihydrodipicolinate synthase family protein n=1 Tax=Parafilimonas sp. TaxID=1969739 RepID=UPI0039E68F00
MLKKFVPVMLTPFTPQAGLDFDALGILVDFYLAAGVKGLFANCLSSEMYSLNEEERITLTKAVVRRVNGRVPVVATGSFGATINDKAEFTKKMYDTGVDAVVLITAHYARIEEPEEVLMQGFEKMLSLTQDIPLGLYECPAPYKRLISPAGLKTLVNTGRIVYHKDTCCSVQQVQEKLDMVKGTSLQFYDAHTPNAVTSMKAGASGMSSISGNFYPEALVWLCNNVTDAQKQEDVQWLQHALSKADPLIHASYPMSAKFFLQKRGLPIHAISRAHPAEPTPKEMAALHDIYSRMKDWFVRLGIEAAGI